TPPAHPTHNPVFPAFDIESFRTPSSALRGHIRASSSFEETVYRISRGAGVAILPFIDISKKQALACGPENRQRMFFWKTGCGMV
ncbi:MAG: hypothetical protein P4L43_05255, partial [Syntrophobacteraceae bacterium]|nr:hypothetical protein [Syntrophobacteraceae bacterium]